MFEIPEKQPVSSESTNSYESSGCVLVCCSSPELRLYIQKALAVAQLESRTLTNLQEVRDFLGEDSNFNGILVELEDPLPESSTKVLKKFCEDFDSLSVLAIAPNPSAGLVRDAMRCGVIDFFTNPFQTRELGESILQAIELNKNSPSVNVDTQKEVTSQAPRSVKTAELKNEPASSEKPTSGSEEPQHSAIITKNASMERVLQIIDTVAPTDSTVLVEGESGTGKELIARRIHRQSLRCDGPFIEVHCGAIPPNLLESELFGHERGSFTGAVSRQVGLFEIANGGTIFLDEIAEMNLDMQVKLLRVLQERTFRRIGGKSNLHTNVRVVAATNRDLKVEVESKRFRADLYYRLNVISLKVPALQERLEDIPHLVEFFADRFYTEKNLPQKSFHTESLDKLQKVRWVGNVRELENAVERLLLLSPGDVIQAEDVEVNLEVSGSSPVEQGVETFDPSLTLDEVKSIHISNVLKANNGNKMKSARILGINIKTLYNLIQRLKIPVE